jgi:hypothetical protein
MPGQHRAHLSAHSASSWQRGEGLRVQNHLQGDSLLALDLAAQYIEQRAKFARLKTKGYLLIHYNLNACHILIISFYQNRTT